MNTYGSKNGGNCFNSHGHLGHGHQVGVLLGHREPTDGITPTQCVDEYVIGSRIVKPDSLG